LRSATMGRTKRVRTKKETYVSSSNDRLPSELLSLLIGKIPVVSLSKLVKRK